MFLNANTQHVSPLCWSHYVATCDRPHYVWIRNKPKGSFKDRVSYERTSQFFVAIWAPGARREQPPVTTSSSVKPQWPWSQNLRVACTARILVHLDSVSRSSQSKSLLPATWGALTSFCGSVKCCPLSLKSNLSSGIPDFLKGLLHLEVILKQMRWESSKSSYRIISPKVIRKAIIIITSTYQQRRVYWWAFKALREVHLLLPCHSETYK